MSESKERVGCGESITEINAYYGLINDAAAIKSTCKTGQEIEKSLQAAELKAAERRSKSLLGLPAL